MKGNVITRFIGTTGLKAKKYSPELLMIAGTGLFIATIVAFVKAQPKAEKVLEDISDEKERIREASELNTYTKEEKIHDEVVVAKEAAIGLGKAYLAPATLAAGTLGCFFGAYGIIKGRNAALMAAYASLDTAFKNYRERVRGDAGDMKDYEYLTGSKVETNSETGELVLNIAPPTKDQTGYTQYARFFDSSSMYYSDRPEDNLLFLKGMEEKLNDRLHIKGHVFLNEVYDALDIPHSQSGCFVGWILKNPTDRIDFGIFNNGDTHEAVRRFINGYEPVILLDFNVDGIIYDKI